MLRFVSFISGAFALTLSLAPIAQAAPVVFTATGHPDVVGYVTLDDSLFNGTASQGIRNEDVILALSLKVFDMVFDLDDVVLADSTFIDSSGAVPVIHNGGGSLAINAAGQEISFYPSDNATPDDGDASLHFFDPEAGEFGFLAVRWEIEQATDVPEPAALALLGAGLAGIGWMRRRRRGA